MDENTFGVEEQSVADSAGVEGQNVADSAMDDKDFDDYIDGIMEGENRAEQSPAPTMSESVEEESESDDVAEPFKSFATEEEYQGEIDRIFSKRFHDYKRVTEERDEMLDNLKEFYGVDDSEEAYSLFKNQLVASKAEDAGLSVDDYVEQSEQARKAKAYDKQMEYQERVEQERQRLISEAEQIKSDDKTFDLLKVYNSDKDFKADLDRTGSVYLAYANYVKRLPQSAEPTAPSESELAMRVSAGQEKMSVPSKRSFKEGGTAKSSSRGRVSSSPADLSDDDFEEYIKKIEGNL